MGSGYIAGSPRQRASHQTIHLPGQLESVFLADCPDLFQMVATVNNMESAPLIHGKWSEHKVRNGSTICKDLLSACRNPIQPDQLRTDPLR
jgi:hypothetical protein